MLGGGVLGGGVLGGGVVGVCVAVAVAVGVDVGVGVGVGVAVRDGEGWGSAVRLAVGDGVKVGAGAWSSWLALTFAGGESMIHDLVNAGSDDLVFTTVEFLQSANAPLPLAEEARA